MCALFVVSQTLEVSNQPNELIIYHIDLAPHNLKSCPSMANKKITTGICGLFKA